MFRKATFVVLTWLGLVVTSTTWAAAPPAVATEPVVVSASTGVGVMYPIVLAAGALAGVATVNALTYSVGTLPLSIGIPTTAPFVSPAAAAASRIFVITSGVVGAWIADALYHSVQ